MQRVVNRIENRFDLMEHVVVPETQHAETLRFHRRRPGAVATSMMIQRMLAAIELDDDSWIKAGEVRKERSDRNLPAKMTSFDRQPPAQMPPQLLLCIGGVIPQ